MRKTSYVAKAKKGWKMSWHYDGPLGKAICGRPSSYSTSVVNRVNCKKCLEIMRKENIINEETYIELINNPGEYAESSI